MTHRFRFTSRRQILRTVITLGGYAATIPLHRAWAAAAITPAQTKGPFYPVTRPLDSDADLTIVQGRSGHAQGKIVHLMGHVLDDDGEPVRDAKIEVWQANARGRYAHPSDVNPEPLDPNFQGFGAQITDDEGQYRFKTIKPGAYPINPMNPDAVRPPHIHFNIAGQNRRLVTQMYFPDEESNGSDIIFGALTAEEKTAVMASLMQPDADLEPDSIVARWDIVLAE